MPVQNERAHGPRSRVEENRTFTVGFGRPPKNHQFKKGQSGNRRGRPRKNDNLLDIFKHVVAERIAVSDPNGSRTMTKGDAVLLMNFTKMLKGNQSAMHHVFRLADEVELFVDRSDRKQVGGLLGIPDLGPYKSFEACVEALDGLMYERTQLRAKLEEKQRSERGPKSTKS